MAKRKVKEVNTKRSLVSDGFYSDRTRSGMLYASIIRSPASTGKVTKITIPDLPEGYTFFTAKDIPGKKTIKLNNSTINIFTEKEVSYTGEPLGIIVGPDNYMVQKIKEQVNIIFDITSLESALKKVIKQTKRPVLPSSSDITDLVSTLNQLPSLDTVTDSISSLNSKEKEIARRTVKTGLYENLTEKEVIDYFLEKKDIKTILVSGTFKHTLSNSIWTEPSGAFAYVENGDLHVYCPTKWTSFTLKSISESLDIPQEKIFIHKTKISDVSASGLWKTTQLAIQAALGTILTKKPVKLMLTQNEQQIFMSPNIDTMFDFKTITTVDGHIKAMDINITVDAGLGNPFAQEIADRLSIAVCNYYRTENLNIETVIHTSQNPPTSICVTRIDSMAFFAIENHIQQISNKTNILPDELRLINLNEKVPDFPFSFSLGDTNLAMQNTIRISDFNRKYTAFKLDAIDRVRKESNPFFALPLRGIGISNAYNASGYYGASAFPYNPKIEVILYPEDKVVIHSLHVSEIIQTIWKKSVSEQLKIPLENISFNSEYELDDFPESPEDSYSSMGIMNDLIKKCCADIQKKRFFQPLPISSKKQISASQKKNWNKEKFSGNPFHTTAFASTVVEVELDSYTYSEKIKGIWITIDCGELYDEAAARKTIQLQVQQELMTLVKGTSITCNSCIIDFVNSNKKPGQIGELVHNTLLSAFTSALSMALATQLSELPCTEDQIYKLIKNRETEPDIEDVMNEPKIITENE